MNRSSASQRLGFLGILFLWCVCATGASATTRTVSTSGVDTGTCASSPCLTIGYAVSQSASDDTINVGAGTYTESVTITISLTINGAGSGTIVTGPTPTVGASQGGAFIVNTSGVTVTISNLTVQDSLAQGGNGGTGGGAGGGGGGAGMGGALFVGAGANVT